MSTNTTPTPEQLQQQFGLPDAVRFEPGEGGLTRAVLTSAAARAEVYLYGAHVTSFQRTNEPDVMYLSERSHFEPGQSIRGGIPICFPWFGNHGDPMHGTARLQTWDVADAAVEGDRVTLELATTIEPYAVRYRVTVGPTLEVAMRTQNVSSAPATFELALHTYFAVSDVRQIQVTGLEGQRYLDKPQNFAERTQEGPIRFEGEVDRVYQHTTDICTIHDPGHGRSITIEKQNGHSTIVWNPWQSESGGPSDLASDSWQRFVCVESGNVHDNAITLEPGAQQETAARIAVAPA